MTALLSLHNAIFARIETLAPWVLPTLARLVFAGVLLEYFWASALTKLGDGLFGIFRPSTGAYAQIFPQKAEAVLYDVSQFSLFEKLVVLGGTWAEFILPVLIVIGLATRLSALGMIGFVVVQSLTDIYGHNADATAIGGWFDRFSDAQIMDQRALWVFLLLYLVMRGGGPLSVDAVICRRLSQDT